MGTTKKMSDDGHLTLKLQPIMFSMAQMTVMVMPMGLLMTVTEIVTLTITLMMIIMMTVIIVMCRKSVNV